MDNWINSSNKDKGAVLSSRIRFARNLRKIPFPDKLSDEQGKQIVDSVSSKFLSDENIKEKFKCIYLWQNDKNSNIEYLERHLISRKLIENKNKSAFIINENETVSIMLNEEDHVRLQGISSGFNLMNVYDELNKIDDILEKSVDYAFDEKLGYLTACPTNLGTGMRASVMVHLPALSMNNEMNGVLNVLTQIGITIRGMFGEGSRALGDLYQISNQITLGISEIDIISNLNAVVNQILNQEKLSREQIMKNYKYELEDKIYRSLAILKNAVILDKDEFLKLISSVRMGVEMGIIKDIDIGKLDTLLINAQTASLKRIYNKNLSDKEEDIMRADYVKNSLR
ncbi:MULTISPECIES: protein arginine kinase [Clostridium]|uniref:protein arginine kinase n=1 Tax=Clostridium TaxID=1485 RepID=UPI00069EC503|nr:MULTISPECIES: protein arginine kinase [Clostridium]KOF56865.1 ATP:guanido phosphotransferase [Clostridium sp. DMHC 10]MCD2348425.1 protein arginine kinase [Clostridium guangxiense]